LRRFAATWVVPRLGLQTTFTVFLGSVMPGLCLWAIGAGSLLATGAGIALLGLGFAASNSMQQARLAAAAPDLASASIALNTSIAAAILLAFTWQRGAR
jgi:hypothetical protein